MSEAERTAALARPPQRDDASLVADVCAIVDDVRARGWEAVADHALRLDGEAPATSPVAPIAAEARRRLSADQIAAIELAYRNIVAFHRGSLPHEHARRNPCRASSCARCGGRSTGSALYVPGGKTPLFSTLMMLAIPAQAAGVKEIVVVTPPRPDGGLDPVLAFAADLCGIEAIWTVGGAQAIAALAFGAGDITARRQDLRPRQRLCRRSKDLCRVAVRRTGDRHARRARANCWSSPMTVPIRALSPPTCLSQAEHDAVGAGAAWSRRPSGSPTRSRPNSRDGWRRFRVRAIAQVSLGNARIDPGRDAGRGNGGRQPLCAGTSVAGGRGSRGVDRSGPQCRCGLRGALGGRDVRRLSRRIEPRPADRRRRPRLERHFGLFTFSRRSACRGLSPEAARRLAGPAAALARLEGLEAHARAADARAGGCVMTSLAARLARPEILALPPLDIAAKANDAFAPTRSGSMPMKIPLRRWSKGRWPPTSTAIRSRSRRSFGSRWPRSTACGPANLVVTRGGDDAIDMLIRTFCRAASRRASRSARRPSRPMPISRGSRARGVIEVPLDAGFRFRCRCASSSGRRTIRRSSSPSSARPTTRPAIPSIPPHVLRVADALPDTIIVLDEAYIEFSETESLAAEAARRPNLVVLRPCPRPMASPARASARRSAMPS